MTLDDQPNFAEAFRRVVQTFRLRLKVAELETLTTTYFKILQAWSLEEVLAAGKTCITKGRRFPQPVDWLAALPAKTTVATDLRWMGADEAAEYTRAEGLHYEDNPCACLLCQAAHVTDKPLRFVPDFMDGQNQPARAFHPGKNAAVTAGHWAHGEELVRWYAARDRFFSLYARVARSRQIPRVLELVGGREPGQEG